MNDCVLIPTRFWNDAKALSPKAKLLALFLLTGPHTNLPHCSHLSKRYVATVLGWDIETVSQLLTELLQSCGQIDVCEKVCGTNGLILLD